MRKFLLILAFFAALEAGTVQAKEYPDRDRIIRRYDENRVYRDDRGEYHWQVVVREVWIPEQRVGGIFGSRRIPGHYEQRQQRVKIYHYSNRYNNNDRYSGKRQHPHGMPPGQRKKQQGRYNDSRGRENDRRWDNDRNDRRNDDGRWDDDDRRDRRRENDRWDD